MALRTTNIANISVGDVGMLPKKQKKYKAIWICRTFFFPIHLQKEQPISKRYTFTKEKKKKKVHVIPDKFHARGRAKNVRFGRRRKRIWALLSGRIW